MSGRKQPEPAQAKRSSRLAAREESAADTRKRGREDRRGNSSPQQPSKRGRAAEAPAPDAKAKGSPVPATAAVATRSQPSPAAPVPAPAVAPAAAQTKQVTSGGAAAAAPAAAPAGQQAQQAPAPGAPAATLAAPAASKSSPAPAPVSSAPAPARSSERNSSQGLGGVLAAAQARKEASFNTQSIAPQRTPAPAGATRKASATAVPATLQTQLPQPTASSTQQPQVSPQSAANRPTQRAQPPMQDPGSAPKAGVPQQKVAPACVGSAKPPDSRAGTANLGKDKAAAAAAAAKSAANKPKLREGTSVPAAQGAMPKIVIKQGGQHISAGAERRPVVPPLTQAQETVTTEVRKGLWATVERWLAARAKLPGDDQDKCQDRFKSEIKRLCQMFVFDEYKQSQIQDQHCIGEELSDERDHGSMRREITNTKFGFRVSASHPRPPPPLIFEATTHIFSADSVFGKTQQGLKDVKWKMEVVLEGIFALTLNTQSMEMHEDIDLGTLEQLRSTLNTELTLSELGVLLIIAGLCCKGVAAWVEVQDLCFWSHNFTIPELQFAQM